MSTQQTVSGTFTATGQSASFIPMPKPAAFERGSGYFNITLSGTFSATIAVQRSFDEGSTWHTVSQDATGTAAEYTAALSLVALEPEPSVLYLLNCTAHASGTVTYRMSR